MLDDGLEVPNRLEDCVGGFYIDLEDSDEIRLLHLQPRSSGEAINCTVELFKLSANPQYEALSYMWGPKNILQPILINGNPYDVRENLWLALHHLRLDSEIRVLWIDAICINQQNIHERNHQVIQMGRIYHEATRVVVWLGASDPSSRLAFKVLLSAEWIEVIRSSKDPEKSTERDHQLNAIFSLLTRAYWKRLWIIQEVLMARDLIIQCGSDNCSRFRL
jgi:hypothetical protein